jgi:2-aminoadipate transaminase
MELALARPNLISLAAGFTDSESLPVRDARELLNELLRSPRTGRTALQYGTTAGDPDLRRLTARRLRVADGTPARSRVHDPQRLMITSGSQQLLYMVTEALCDPGDIVLVEDPTYFVYLGILQSHGLRARGVRMGRDGLDLAHLDTVLAALRRSDELPRVKMLYLVSYFQNPTGATTSFAKKRAALALLKHYERAAGHPIYLFEDAAYRELRFAGADEPSALVSPGAMERVIYGGTYSKPFATGVRVGFGLLPADLHRVVMRIKGNHDFGTSNLLQQLLARALASGRYTAHLEVLRRRYARKATLMQAALRKHFPARAEWWTPEGGLYFWARLPRGVRSGVRSKLFQTALRHGVLYVPGALCYADDPTRPKPDHELRISYGSARAADLRTGIARLGDVLRESVKPPPGRGRMRR